ncbi:MULTISPECIES: hypothetical protein [Mycolicibacterium]|uniref:Uncharacterized protein n=2 Tax=Mycolicibacterium TaxID=1866885 RepID=A0A1A0W8Y6_MYCPR|nr:hypothetical protein [Mycolicibacterium peregrinum]OBB92905.1 hypothetical protein A5779_21320 [Mycolicibacterium peregrinum]
MSEQIHGELDALAQDAQGLQEVSDQQAALMHSLASTMEGLSTSMIGRASLAMQQVGEQLHHEGNLMSTTFADHSHMMNNNRQILDSGDEENAHAISQISNLIV